MRQYFVFYRRGGQDQKWGKLTPFVHLGLYDRREIRQAVTFMRENPSVEGVAIRLGDESFNLVVFTQEATAPQAFSFEEVSE
jgi:hypothetical protein